MKEIKLTQGKVALVDDEDYEWLNQWKWHAMPSKSKRNFYAVRNEKQENGHRTIYMHVFIMGKIIGLKVDHGDCDELNNQRYNLRHCTHQENCRNAKHRINCSSEYKGVFWDGKMKKWRASIRVNGKANHLGFFDIETDAAEAYRASSTKHFGEFAKTNFKQGNE